MSTSVSVTEKPAYVFLGLTGPNWAQARDIRTHLLVTIVSRNRYSVYDTKPATYIHNEEPAAAKLFPIPPQPSPSHICWASSKMVELEQAQHLWLQFTAGTGALPTAHSTE